MATYNELFTLRRENTDLLNRITVAVTKKAQALLDTVGATQAQVAWAEAAIQNPAAKADPLFNYILAKNSGLTGQQITGATDAAIQSAVDAAVDALISGGV